MLHTLNPCNNSCNTPFSTVSGHHPRLSDRGSSDPPLLHPAASPLTPSVMIPGSPRHPDTASVSGHVSADLRADGGRSPGRILFPRNGTWNRSGAMWMVGRCPRPAMGIKCLKTKGKGVCEEMGRRLPLRGLPDGSALHEDPPEQGALHHTSS